MQPVEAFAHVASLQRHEYFEAAGKTQHAFCSACNSAAASPTCLASCSCTCAPLATPAPAPGTVCRQHFVPPPPLPPATAPGRLPCSGLSLLDTHPVAGYASAPSSQRSDILY